MIASVCVWRALRGPRQNNLERLFHWLVSPERDVAARHFPEVVFVAGLLLTLLFSLSIYLAQRLSVRAAERKRAEAALRKAHAELELRVGERTAELSRVNEELKEEIRQRQRLEGMLRQRAKLLVEADRRKDVFLTMLGHELRNPLATLALGLETLRLECSTDALAPRIELLGRQLGYVVRLVNDLLDLSRITRGRIRLQKSVVDLREVVRDTVEDLLPRLEASRLRLCVALPREALLLEADPVRLRQVLSNLLDNAAKYTGTDGHIWVAASREGQHAVLSVKDTGMGIPARLLPRIFDSFVQGDSSLDRGKGGLGLGLALVQRLVGLHGGAVEARSDGPGKGSEFTVKLPVPAGASGGWMAQAGGERVAAPERSGCRRVLVVDDGREIAAMLQRLLRGWGHEVIVARNGPAALHAAMGRPPDAALIDIGLPGMDGYELARRLRKQVGGPLLLIALTGYTHPDHRRLSRAAGFDRHLGKPVDLNVLRELLGAGSGVYAAARG